MVIKVIFRSVCAFMAVAAFAACSGNDLVGEWVEPIPGMENQIQGISLEKDGIASSINMSTLQYEKWERKGDMLILSGKSIGNHMTLSFADTLMIEKLTADELILRQNNLSRKYRKRFSADE